MANKLNTRLLRIFIGQSDNIHGKPLYKKIIFESKRQGMAGATVFEGIMSFGANSLIHDEKQVDLSDDLPIVIEIIDDESQINKFLETLNELFNDAGCGGLITIEKLRIEQYEPKQINIEG